MCVFILCMVLTYIEFVYFDNIGMRFRNREREREGERERDREREREESRGGKLSINVVRNSEGYVDWWFRPRFCTCTTLLDRRQPRRMR